MTIPLPVIVALAVGLYLLGALITRAFCSLMDDGPTFIPRLDALIVAAAILLSPATWVLVLVVAVVCALIRIATP